MKNTPRVYRMIYKNFTNTVYLRHIERVKTEKFKFELDKFLEFIPDEPIMPIYVTEARSNIILDHAAISS